MRNNHTTKQSNQKRNKPINKGRGGNGGKEKNKRPGKAARSKGGKGKGNKSFKRR